MLNEHTSDPAKRELQELQELQAVADVGATQAQASIHATLALVKPVADAVPPAVIGIAALMEYLKGASVAAFTLCHGAAEAEAETEFDAMEAYMREIIRQSRLYVAKGIADLEAKEGKV